MGGEISVPIGTYVLAYNNTGATKAYGNQVDGALLKPSYVPGSYPGALYTFKPGEVFECRGYSHVRTTCLWVRVL